MEVFIRFRKLSFRKLSFRKLSFRKLKTQLEDLIVAPLFRCTSTRRSRRGFWHERLSHVTCDGGDGAIAPRGATFGRFYPPHLRLLFRKQFVHLSGLERWTNGTGGLVGSTHVG